MNGYTGIDFRTPVADNIPAGEYGIGRTAGGGLRNHKKTGIGQIRVLGQCHRKGGSSLGHDAQIGGCLQCLVDRQQHIDGCRCHSSARRVIGPLGGVLDGYGSRRATVGRCHRFIGQLALIIGGIDGRDVVIPGIVAIGQVFINRCRYQVGI